MPFNPETKYPSDIIMAEDWNEAMEEVVKLGKNKLDLEGGILKGSLKIEKSPADQSGVCLHLKATDGLTLPSGTKAERPINIQHGTIRFNTEEKSMEVFDGNKWMSLMPVGTILPFAGEVVPDGWFSCDGQLLETGEYPALALVLNSAWGKRGSKFKLPDLRGMFLRGWDQGQGNDPESKNRTKKQGGNAADMVGSYQEDQFQGHKFPVYGGGGPNTGIELNTLAHHPANGHYFGIAGNGSGRVGYAIGPESDAGNGNPRVGQETRPKNAYVHFIIKY